MKRIEANDPAAMVDMGLYLCEDGDFDGAFEYLTKAAELGHADAHNMLALMYQYGKGVEKDAEQEVYHLEEAAIGGHCGSRHNLGCLEWLNGRLDRAVKHFIIAANLGFQNSLNGLKHLYADGHASKEDYAGALRAYQAAVNATKSSEREKAEEK